MTSRSCLVRPAISLVFRPARPSTTFPTRVWRLSSRRYADDAKEVRQKEPTGPNQDVLPHVSEEAAATGNITGEGGPEIEQGTSVQDVLKREEKAKDKAPKVIREDINSSSSSQKKGTRSYSTLRTMSETDLEPSGVKFGLPELPLPSGARLKHRYPPGVEQVTKMLMRHGKLSEAQRQMSVILGHLRAAPPPVVNANRPLLPGAPPASHLPLHPVLYLTLAVDSVAPMFRIRSQRGMAGGGVALPLPVPLRLRQRRRRAIGWILDAVEKKGSRGSGKDQLGHRVAEEIVAVVEGRSSVWEKRTGVHKVAISARANVNTRPRRR
ncbi:MAG: hypothetical protein M1817_005915 [Caeruleum heppii]|nr:MAG: hypothetical protein M1817_005915 [Caeruleum heppii]